MDSETQIALLRQGVVAWNEWRIKHASIKPKLGSAALDAAELTGVDLSGAILADASLRYADLGGGDLSGTFLYKANLNHANLENANLSGSNLGRASLYMACLSGSDLSGASCHRANLCEADLRGANLSRADLTMSNLVEADLSGADLTGCQIYGISAWGLKLSEDTKQQNLVITPPSEPEVTVDNIEVAQLVYLLLHNENIRNVIDTIGRKGVLLLGRFTDGRIAVLERLREELRKRGFLPIVFNFDKPETKDFTETVKLLAGLSHFVIVDITNPRSAPLELQATVPNCMVPFVPILEEGEEPFAMLADLWRKHQEWVFEPIAYPSVDRLVEVFDVEIVRPAQAKFAALLARKAQELPVRRI
jgi:hypothetical protein